MPGSSAKQWRAFLSAHADENGKSVNAIDRIGEGPWYDRLGRLVSQTKADLVADVRPNADPAIRNDLPNEDGVPNHQPDPNQPQQANHHTLTGSTEKGELYPDLEPDGGGDPLSSTCSDWTTADGSYPGGIEIRQTRTRVSFGSSGRPHGGLSWSRAGKEDPWLSRFTAVGCAPGGAVTPNFSDKTVPSVGFGDGYGGIYCFALTP